MNPKLLCFVNVLLLVLLLQGCNKYPLKPEFELEDPSSVSD
jgi:hypothetical protein